ncbi:unnamed protein product, partial [Ectocarpus sp. 12 AP-2014]
IKKGESKELGKERKKGKALEGRKEAAQTEGGEVKVDDGEEREEDDQDNDEEDEEEEKKQEEAGVAEYHERGLGSKVSWGDENNEVDDSGGSGSSADDVEGGRRAKAEGPKGAAALVLKGSKPPVRERRGR